jgi:hypothetical protein
MTGPTLREQMLLAFRRDRPGISVAAIARILGVVPPALRPGRCDSLTVVAQHLATWAEHPGHTAYGLTWTLRDGARICVPS